ncbi:hypothetical protein ACHZ97_14005 [Lysobacter soli]|uniref:hypothetical protein n=1 Tax=Lysobacter soli TaxID=453783 RepID=UPI0037C9E6B1
MATGFPFNDRRQRPEVMGVGPAASQAGPFIERPALSQDHQHDPARARARGRSYVDFASVPGGQNRPHRDVLG